MAKKKSESKQPKKIDTITHAEAKRRNIPTAEYQSVMEKEQQDPLRVAYERRNRDLDPQLIWRGKDLLDWSDLVVQAPPLYIQEKIHPKVLIDDLTRQTEAQKAGESGAQTDLFADFNGLPDDYSRTEFYRHDQNWSNRMILGDSLQVMASLAEREGLRGKVQCIYIDPPYGIKFNSNFQWSTTSRDVKDGKAEHITREPEQVKAFRDTWRDGIHSYLTYLRDRLTVARDLLADSGSIFVQIGDENVHRVRALMDEVFGQDNACSQIAFVKTTGFLSNTLPNVTDHMVWYAKDKSRVKFRQPYYGKQLGGDGSKEYTVGDFPGGVRRTLTRDEKNDPSLLPDGTRVLRLDNLRSQGSSDEGSRPYEFEGIIYPCGTNMHWKTRRQGLDVLSRAGRLAGRGEGRTLCYLRYVDDFAAYPVGNVWTDAASGDNQVLQKLYVVQTLPKVIERCILMATDPGDLVLDPTCGSGTTAYVAEQWGRRWITIDTSRVALALARARIMGARYPYYLLSDSKAGQEKEAELTRTAPSEAPTYGDIRQGFVYERVPHITLKSIANNAEIDVIYEKLQPKVQEALKRLNKALRGHKTPFKVTTGGRQGKKVQFDADDGATFTMPSGEEVPAYELVEWEVPREAPDDWPPATQPLLTTFWEARIARQKAIDASIAARAEYEYLYDKPYEDKKTVRVAGPFTVESLSPHRVLGVDEDDELIDQSAEAGGDYGRPQDFATMILENLRRAGVQQAHKEDKIGFTSLTPWPGTYICAEGRYFQGGEETGTMKRAGVLIGPEFGTVSRPDLVAAAREAGDADFDVLIACAFNYDAHSSEFNQLGRVPVLKARMNADLHMAEDLKNTGKGNLFVIFGEPDIDLLDAEDGQIQVKINGVDVFHPNTGEVRSDGPEGIACWFIDTDYNEESFFVRHAYFLGANDPYKSLKTTLKAEINEEAWDSLNSDISRPFDKPANGRIAVKVINHLGDEVMKVFRV